MWAFYEEMQARLEAMGEEVVPFDDIVNEFMDIVHPERRGHISLMELRRSLLGYNVVSALSNVRKYVAWEGAHGPKAVQPSPRLASPLPAASPSADPSLRHPSLNPLPPCTSRAVLLSSPRLFFGRALVRKGGGARLQPARDARLVRHPRIEPRPRLDRRAPVAGCLRWRRRRDPVS